MQVKNLLYFISAIIFISSCSLERRVANNFVKSGKSISILIMEPELIVKKNHKVVYTDKYKKLETQAQKDSLEMAKSKFLKNMKEKEVTGFFNYNLFKYLRQYPNVKIYSSKNMNEFLKIKENAYIFNFAQIEFEEYFLPYRDSAYFNGRKYVQEMARDALSMNFWIEITKVNSQDDKMKVAFTSVHAFDDIDGYFSYNFFLDEINYSYSRDNITGDDVENMIRYAGRKNAFLAYDYIINRHIAEKLIPGKEGDMFFHYDLKSKRFIKVNDEKYKFLFLE